MRIRFRYTVGVAAAASALALGLPLAAHADVVAPPAPPSVSPDIEAQIAAIPIPSLESQIQARADEITASGGELLSVTYTPFEDQSAASTMASATASTAAATLDCGLAVTLSRSGMTVTDGVYVSCKTTVFTKLVLRARLMLVNPYNATDYRIPVDTSVTFGAGRSAYHSVSFTCKNSNQTSFQGYGKGTLTVSGVQHAKEAYDSMTAIKCGW